MNSLRIPFFCWLFRLLGFLEKSQQKQKGAAKA
jgi:hypothetical protein